MSKKKLNTYQRWDGIAKSIMKGKKIVDVGYLDKSEAEHYAWFNRGVWFQLD